MLNVNRYVNRRFGGVARAMENSGRAGQTQPTVFTIRLQPDHHFGDQYQT